MKNLSFYKSMLTIMFMLLVGCIAFSQQEIQQKPGKLVELKLSDGTSMMGEVISEDSESITIKSATLGEMTIKKSDIKEMTEIKSSQIKKGKYWFANPNSTRYLFGPTGRNLKKGQGYYQNVLITTNMAHYGITDWFSIGGGFEGVSLVIGEPVFFIMPKFGFEITEMFSVGAGYVYANAAAAFEEEGGFKGIGLAYGAITYGNDDYHATIGLGWGQAGGELTNNPFITFSGFTRVSRRIGLVTENWMIPTDQYYWIFTYGIKLLGEKSSFDIAFINSRDIAEEVAVVGLPIWFSYNFYF